MRKVLQCSHWQPKSFSLSTYASRFVSFLPEGVTLNGWFSMGSSLSKAIIWPAKRNIFLNMGFLLLKHWIMSSLLLSFSKFWWHSLNNPMKIFCQLEYILKDFWIVKRHAWIPCFDIIKKTTNYFLKNSIFHPAITKLLHNSVCNLFLFRNMKKYKWSHIYATTRCRKTDTSTNVFITSWFKGYNFRASDIRISAF